MMFDRFKGWRRVTTRYDRYAQVFLSFVPVAAIVIFRP